MTTRIPTAESIGELSLPADPTLPGGLDLAAGAKRPAGITSPEEIALRAGLPDVATLARMANEFFSALPGVVAGGAPSVIPSSAAAPVSVASAPSSLSSAVPHAPVASSIPTFATAEASPGVDTAVRALEDLSSLAARSFSLPVSPPLEVPNVPGAPGFALAAGLPAASTSPSFYFLEPPFLRSTAEASHETSRHPPFNVAAVRRDFPILSERVKGRPLIWLDNAATTQKPQCVIDRLVHFYRHENSNIHRAAHELAARSTDAYEGARDTVRRFLGAASAEEIVFVRGATEAINLVAQSWGRQNILPGDEIIVSHLEHHANIVPWQQLASEKGARLRVIPVDDSGQILLEEFQRLLNARTKLVSVTQVSNALGTIVPVREVSEIAHRAGATVLIDGAQAVSHMPVDVQALGADFYVFSGHKVFGPTGIGALYGKSAVLEAMPPWQGGGNMISSVTFERTSYQGPPSRFEAGTGNIADAAGLAAALDYVMRIGLEAIERYEHDLLVYATAALTSVPGLHLIGTARDKASVLSFVLDGHDPIAVGSALNEEGIAVRAGHHCAEPILRRFGVSATVRPSLAFYNTCEEVDALVAALRRLVGSAGRR